MWWIGSSYYALCLLLVIVHAVSSVDYEIISQCPYTLLDQTKDLSVVSTCSYSGSDAKSVLLRRSFRAVRGGGDLRNVTETASSPDSIIVEFLSAPGNDNVDCNGNGLNRFHVQGWRWHTLSFTRDTERLKKLAIRTLNSQSAITTNNKSKCDTNQHPLKMAVSYVVDFNLRGLQRIEDDIFFPWVREKLTKTNLDVNQGPEINNAVIVAFKNLLDGIDDDRRKVAELADKLKERVEIATSTTSATAMHDGCTSAASDVIDLSNSICTLMKSISSKEECFLVPALAKIVPAKEQKSFNSKILRKLGLLEARVHLVGMYDAVHDDVYGNKEEKSLFEQEIPTLPKMMISRWRKTLYQPRAGVLDDVDSDV